MFNLKKNLRVGAGEMDQYFRILIILPEISGSISSTHMETNEYL